VSARVRSHVVELGGIQPALLADTGALAAALIAAAGAVGLATEGPPAVLRSADGVAVALVCRDGHLVMHTGPEAGVCLVDVAAREPRPVELGMEIIARRLGVAVPAQG